MKKILIIEDEPAMRSNLRQILEMEDFQPVTAANGREGITAAKQVLEVLRADSATARVPFIFLTAKGEHVDIRAGMNLGADDYLVKPVRVDDLLDAIAARLERAQQRADFTTDFKSAAPLEKLGISSREAEILLWVAQGKTNFEVATILNISSGTVKKHLEHIYAKMGVEGRNSASLKAVETLASAQKG
jgi:DNA-binding NarL/FixJ family response regulator